VYTRQDAVVSCSNWEVTQQKEERKTNFLDLKTISHYTKQTLFCLMFVCLHRISGCFILTVSSQSIPCKIISVTSQLLGHSARRRLFIFCVVWIRKRRKEDTSLRQSLWFFTKDCCLQAKIPFFVLLHTFSNLSSGINVFYQNILFNFQIIFFL